MPQHSRIQLLDNRLANQIAAGEVVERPASVVKELVENSIDAGATVIEVEIERGGTRLIRVNDNGKGIHQLDLALALTRHATSKIRCSQDLAAIGSLGFRGEALASVSAVSKLTLTSRTHDSELAWQAIAQGRDMAVEVLPAAATPGTRIEVAELFYNTPARQKFLRTEKTEFNHIEDVFKRHALANFSVAFVLKHNQKVVKRVPACGAAEQQLKRITTICGKGFAENCVEFNCQHESIQLFGWLGKTNFHRSESDIQYVFINGRPVKDKTLNHAIRQSYQGRLPAGRMPAYIIYLTMDIKQVDVNVHPTKHEVRFGEQRLVHDLLAKSINDALAETDLFDRETLQPPFDTARPVETTAVDYSRVVAEYLTEPLQQNSAHNNISTVAEAAQRFAGQLTRQLVERANDTRIDKLADNTVDPIASYIELELAAENKDANTIQTQLHNSVESVLAKNTVVGLIAVTHNFWISSLDQKAIVIDMQRLLAEFLSALLKNQLASAQQALLFPHQLSLASELLEDYQTHQCLKNLGFDCEPHSGEYLLVKKVPRWLQWRDNRWIFEQLPQWLNNRDSKPQVLAELISASLGLIPAPLAKFLSEQMAQLILQGQSYRELCEVNIQALFE